MKIFLAQQNYHIGNFESNTQKIIGAIDSARNQGGDLVVFSELSVCGYAPRDFLEFDDFIKKCYESIDAIRQHTADIGVLIGAPDRNKVKEGKDLFNAAYLLYQGEVKGIVHKTCLPNYDVFDEYRYFEPAYDWNILEFKGKKLAVTVCEDIWNLGDNPLYRKCPMDELMQYRPDVMINLSASPFDYTHDEDRKMAIRANVLKYKLPLFYCNCIGSQTEVVFDGGSLAFDATANLVGQLPRFEEALQSFVLNDNGSIDGAIAEPLGSHPVGLVDPHVLQEGLHITDVHDAIVLGIRDYFTKMGFSRAIVGSSGGIDSAVTLALACKALGKENVRAVLMPSPFSTPHSVDDAVQLSKNLYESFLSTLEPLFHNSPFGITEENIQSRSRGSLLMAIANKFGYILLNTSNKSELATGYGTLYGDMAGGLGVLGDCYKLQVYELARYINRNGAVIPQNIINKAPSAELSPGQKDTDTLPPYEVLDRILYQYIERTQGPDEIKAQGFEPGVVDKVLRMVNINEYKRNQFCPIIRVSPKAFGVGRRIPIVAKYLG
jgi:NAD+ synthase (glutamine-hydrolysing)